MYAYAQKETVSTTPWITGIKHPDSKRVKKAAMIERRNARKAKRALLERA